MLKPGAALVLLAALAAAVRAADAPPPALPGGPPAVPPATPPRPSPSVLQVAEPTWDAGKVVRGTKLSHAFVLRNVGTTELAIDAKPG